jgi:aryl-alcohol dehydrogenase-like predicted oxidoreductase
MNEFFCVVDAYRLTRYQAMKVLKHAWDRGVTTIDTSNNYSNGYSEMIIGKFLKKV